MTTFSHFQESLFADESTSSQADSPVSRSVPPESEKDETMNDISSPKCFELFERFSPVGSSLKTFAACLVSNLDEYSPRLSHHWKAKVSKSLHFVFLRVPSKPRIDEIDCGLWLTPSSRDHVSDGPKTIKKWQDAIAKGKRPNSSAQRLRNQILMMPTPNVTDATGRTYQYQPSSNKTKIALSLPGFAMLFPTPTAVTDTGGAALCKWGGSGARAKLRKMVSEQELNGALNPQWVEWLMGYPIGYTDLKHSETASSRSSRSRSSKPSKQRRRNGK